MRVLITGGAGFLGSHLLAALAASGHQPISLDVAHPDAQAAAIIATAHKARHHIGQITDQARIFDICRAERIDAIVHAAGLVGLARSLEQPAATYQTNLMGMVNVCEAARQLGIARLIVMSSNAAYHGNEGGDLVETDPVFSVRDGNPAGHYGTSKMAAEAIGLAYARFHALDVLCLRITAIYGFGMREAMYIKPMVEDAVRGRPTRFATGGPMKRDYTHVSDCIDAILRALTRDTTPPDQRVLNIAAGQARTAAEVARTVRAILPGADIEIGEGLTALEAGNLRMRASLDIAAARRILGWSPRLTLDAGIREYAARYKAFLDHQNQEPA